MGRSGASEPLQILFAESAGEVDVANRLDIVRIAGTPHRHGPGGVVSAASPALDVGAAFRDTSADVDSPVAVVTTLADGLPHGSTVSAFVSLSMDPPMPGAGFVACRAADVVDGGDHVMLLGDVLSAASSPRRPLTHHRHAFGTHTRLDTT